MATLDDLGSPGPDASTSIVERPLLFDGQRLDQPTFHELYLRTPEGFRAELIDGVVSLMNMPVFEDHGRSDLDMGGILYLYCMETPGTIAHANTTTIIDRQNEVQPDSALRIEQDYGGRTSVDARRRVIGCPELVIEIASSSLRLDLNAKKQAYETAGALEYVVFDVQNQKFHWFVLQESRLDRIPIAEDGVYRSHAFPGLWVEESAFVRSDKRAVVAVLRRGTDSPQHADFVERLRENRANRP